MAPGLGFLGRRLGGKGKDATRKAEARDGSVTAAGKGKGLGQSPTEVNDSVHSLTGMNGPSTSGLKPSPPPSPTSILPDVNFLDLNGAECKGSEPSISCPEDEPTLTPDDPDWRWHEPAGEVDPKDAATPDRLVRLCSLLTLYGSEP
jgi:hypothetical protein